MANLVLTSATLLTGTSWTGTAPGPGNPTVSGTISSSTDWSTAVRSMTFGHQAAMADFTTFGDALMMANKPGIRSFDIQIEFNQDFASSSVDAVFGPAFLAGTLMYLDVKPTSSSRSSTNVSYVYAAYVSSYTPIGGTVGDRAAAPVTFTVTGTPARLTS